MRRAHQTRFLEWAAEQRETLSDDAEISLAAGDDGVSDVLEGRGICILLGQSICNESFDAVLKELSTSSWSSRTLHWRQSTTTCGGRRGPVRIAGQSRARRTGTHYRGKFVRTLGRAAMQVKDAFVRWKVEDDDDGC